MPTDMTRSTPCTAPGSDSRVSNYSSQEASAFLCKESPLRSNRFGSPPWTVGRNPHLRMRKDVHDSPRHRIDIYPLVGILR